MRYYVRLHVLTVAHQPCGYLKVRMNHRKEYVFSLGGQRGTSLFDYKKREIPLKTSLFSEQQNRFRAGLPAKEALNLAKVYNKNALGRIYPAEPIKTRNGFIKF